MLSRKKQNKTQVKLFIIYWDSGAISESFFLVFSFPTGALSSIYDITVYSVIVR